MFGISSNVIYKQVGKEIVVKIKEQYNTIFLNQSASDVFLAIASGNDVKDEIMRKYHLSETEYIAIGKDITDVLNQLVSLEVIYEK